MPDLRPDIVSALNSAREGIYGIRRQIDSLRPALNVGSSDTINVARQELGGALVRRLEIAEGEIQQLLDMLDLDKKT